MTVYLVVEHDCDAFADIIAGFMNREEAQAMADELSANHWGTFMVQPIEVH